MPAAPEPGSPEEALRRLEQRLDRASEAAERLMAQAAAEAARAGVAFAGGGIGRGAGERASVGDSPGAGDPRGAGEDPSAGEATPSGDFTPPPAGWQTTDDDARESTSELDPLVALVQAMRDLIPPELQRRLIAAVREMLLALR